MCGYVFVPALFCDFCQKTQEVTEIRKKPDKKKSNGILNEDIRAKEVMVISDTGEQIGLKSRSEAIDLAYSRDLDLVLVAPNAKPPVAKFMDYNKYRYEQQKKAREAKKKQNVMQLKELRLSPKIEKHDFDTKIKKGRKFLEDGDKLKLSIRFRGREMAHTNRGRDVMMDFAKKCNDIGQIESHPKQDGRTMVMTLTPKKE